jgi:hypothetical protein
MSVKIAAAAALAAPASAPAATAAPAAEAQREILIRMLAALTSTTTPSTSKRALCFFFIDGDADPAEADDHIDDTEDIEETENGGSSSIVGQKRQDPPI